MAHYVEERLVALKTLKNKYITDVDIAEYKVKANMQEVVESGEDDFRTQISGIVKWQKDADLKNALPEYSFMPENDLGRRNRKVVKQAFTYWWTKTNTDKQIGKVVKSSTTYGTGIIFEGIKHIYKDINTPFYNEDNQLEFKTENKLIYSGIETRKVSFPNFFINGDDIDTSTECVEIQYFDMDGYIAEKEADKLYSNISSIRGTSKDYTFGQGTNGEDIMPAQDDENVVTEITYYNMARDEFIVLANGIEILSTHIPYEHKELPYALYYDNIGEDRIWGIGEFELLKEDEKAKNELRTSLMKGVRTSIGFILKEKDNDFEEDDVFFGHGQIYEVDEISGIQHFAPSVPLQSIINAESMIDTTIIQKTGVDINSMATTSESATKTAGKTVSSKKRINDNIKDNGYGFFRRLAYIRLKNIQFLHSMSVREIPIKGGSILNDGVFQKDESGAYGSAKIGKGMIEGDFLVTPIMDSMLGNNKERRKSNALEYAQVGGSIVGTDGQPVIKGEALAELLTEEFGFDFDRMSQATTSAQSGKDVISKLKNKGNGVSDDANNPASPNYIPPAQRSGATKAVSTLSGKAGMSANDIIAE